MRRRSTLRAGIRVLAICMMLTVSSAAHAVTTSWNTDVSGLFTTAANWDNGVPDSDDTAIFNRGFVGYTVTFPGGTIFEPPVNYAINYLRVNNNHVNFVWNDSFPLQASPSLSVLNPDVSIVVGENAGEVGILGTTLASFSGANTSIGRAPGANGTLNVVGGTFSMSGNLDVGDSGTGTLNVTNGGDVVSSLSHIGQFTGGEGHVTVSGTGSSITVPQLYLGGSPSSPGSSGGGAGTLTIQDGGTVSTGTEAQSYIGFRGSGALNIQNGGSFSGSATISFDHGSTGTVMVTGPGSQWIEYSQLDVGQSSNSTGTLTILNGGLVSGSSSWVRSTGTATVSGDGSTWNNSLGLTVDSNLTIDDGGSVTSGTADIGLLSSTDSSVTVAGAGSQWTIAGELRVGRFFSRGTLNVTNGGIVSSAAALLGAGEEGGTVNVDGPDSTWTIDGVLDVGAFGPGTLSITGGSTVSNGTAFVGPISSAITVDGPGSTWTSEGDLIIDSGELMVSDGATVAVNSGILEIGQASRVAGDGLLSGIVINRGLINPGLNPGAMTGVTTGSLDVDGLYYIQSSTGELQIRLAGTTPGTDYDQLQVNGAVTLNGTLSVALANSFAPSAGNVFDILDWGSLSGTFDTLQLPMLAAGLEWDTSHLYVTGVLSVVPMLPGDYNDDGAVDAADYVAWRKGVGVATTPANYDLWRTNFGRTAGSGASVSTNGFSQVPEPASVMLIVAGIVIGRLTVSRRRRYDTAALGAFFLSFGGRRLRIPRVGPPGQGPVERFNPCKIPLLDSILGSSNESSAHWRDNAGNFLSADQHLFRGSDRDNRRRTDASEPAALVGVELQHCLKRHLSLAERRRRRQH
ncbi:MAG: hypothetical protein L0228_16850 [Planctomycetes bacterium]|nr:hypothetical protein [Planctomycetota bacterium]